MADQLIDSHLSSLDLRIEHLKHLITVIFLHYICNAIFLFLHTALHPACAVVTTPQLGYSYSSQSVPVYGLFS